MSFRGFSLPDGAWLPPELVDILPDIKTMAEIKVTIVAIYMTLRVGAMEAVISISDFEALTGMDHKGVKRGIDRAIERGTITRTPFGNTFLYRLNIDQQSLPAGGHTRGSMGKMPVPQREERAWMPSNRGMMPAKDRGSMPQEQVIPPQKGVVLPQATGKMPVDVVCCNTSSDTKDNIQQDPDKQRLALVAELRQFGVKLVVAQKFVRQYDLEYLREKLSQAVYAVEAGFVHGKGPGWFVTSVKENWQAPMGYHDSLAKKGSTEGRKRYITGKYGHLIEH